MTIKFLKQWGFANPEPERDALQKLLDGGTPIIRNGACVKIGDVTECLDIPGVFNLSTPGEAVKFAAALNKLRRPLHLIKQDLDKDWAARVKERDNNVCVLCGIQGDKLKNGGKGKDVLTAHHWLKTKSRAGMARWARACGATVHFAEHIHTLHENPCWWDLDILYDEVEEHEEGGAIGAACLLVEIPQTESRVRALWLERCGKA